MSRRRGERGGMAVVREGERSGNGGQRGEMGW